MWPDPPDGPIVQMLAICIRCDTPFLADPDTVDVVWVNRETRSAVRPDASQIVPGEPGTSREPACPPCARLLRTYSNRPGPVTTLFPRARWDRIRAHT